MASNCFRAKAARVLAPLSAIFVVIAEAPVVEAAPVQVSTILPHGPSFGSLHPLRATGGSFRWGWVAGCQVREDTDYDEQINVRLLDDHLQGDEGKAYLWTSDGAEHAIGWLVQQSPNGRYAAYMWEGHLIILDAKTNERLDLSQLGAKVAGYGLWSRESVIAFSFGHWALFLRQDDTFSEIVAINLETRELRVMHQTTREILYFWYDAEGSYITIAEATYSLQSKETRPVLHTCLVSRPDPCHPAFSFEPPRLPKQGMRVVYVPVTSLDDVAERQEQLESVSGCVEDGRRVLLRSSWGGLLVGAAKLYKEEQLEKGPVQWVRTGREGNLAPCADYPRRGHLQYVPKVERFAGMNFGVGQWRLNSRPLNKAFESQAFSSTSLNSVVLGGEVVLGYGRLRGAMSMAWVNPKNVSYVNDHRQLARIDGMSWGLSFAYAIVNSRRFSLMPELGTKFAMTSIEFPGQSPPFALAAQYRSLAHPTLEKRAWLLDAAFRIEVNAIELGNPRGYGRPFYLTLGNYLAWEQQLLAGDWRLLDGDQVKGHLSKPSLSLSGPLFLIYAGIVWDPS